MSVAVCRSLKPTLRQNFSMYTNSWNSGNHFLAFWMMDFRNDTSLWCSASLVRHFSAVLGLQFHQLTAVFILLPLHLLLQQLDAFVTGCNLILQGAVVGFKFFQLAASQKRTDLCHKCRFRFGLGGFQLLRLDFLPS